MPAERTPLSPLDALVNYEQAPLLKEIDRLRSQLAAVSAENARLREACELALSRTGSGPQHSVYKLASIGEILRAALAKEPKP